MPCHRKYSTLPAGVFRHAITMLTRPEIYMITNGYIGVNGGYLGDFSYRTYEEFYPYFCDLNISSSAHDGTTRQRFLTILKNADAQTQAKILKGVLKKYPAGFFPEDQQEMKRKASQEIEGLYADLKAVRLLQTNSFMLQTQQLREQYKTRKC